MLFLNIIILVVGFVALIKGADWFVDGSSSLARTFHVSGLIIGLTIVAAGTSMPELAVSTLASIQGSSEIAISNVVGSNIFNLLFILGICAVIHRMPVERGINKRDFPISIGITILVLVTSCIGDVLSGDIMSQNMDTNIGELNRNIAIVLLVLFIGYIAYLIYEARKHPAKEEKVTNKPLWKSIVLIIVGLALIIGGGEAVVHASKEIARTFGMSETLIGLTIVAVGTSLPELVTSIVATRKGEVGIAVGNVVGSNIFNMMFILGIAALIKPVAVNVASVWDMLTLAVVSTLVYVFAITRKSINRIEGIIMVSLYVGYVVFAIVR